MLIDVVLDTNVFLHSQDPRQNLRVAAASLLERLSGCNVMLRVDEGFSVDPARNRSFIGHEYLTHVRFVDQAYALIVLLGRRGQIQETGKSVGAANQRALCRLISDKTDRVFVRVAFNSKSKTLVSHDFADFPTDRRAALRKQLQVATIDAEECLPELF
jgi:hypothetical protein